jgi:hypothetical protein
VGGRRTRRDASATRVEAQRAKFDRPRLIRNHRGLAVIAATLLKPAVLRAVGGEAAGHLRMHILQHRNSLI